ncbi:MAG: NAD(P)H-hydrate dehydratase [Fusobacteriaceae bacterium]|jgi:NAD(P)H-hydrate epimerase|nr:NAD(P)H-hydrate dehydratase [Fusobacteriaceae bacterium]
MKIVTGAQMRAIDKITIEEYGVPGLTLMERAARAVTDLVIRRLREHGWKRVLVLCGKGNNGGDGFAVARQLFAAGYAPQLVFTEKPDALEGDALSNYRRLEALFSVGEYKAGGFDELVGKADIVVDALLGTGIRGDVREPIRGVIESVNKYARYVISVDIPSGVGDADENQGAAAVIADETVTFALPKLSLLTGKGPACCGRLHVADIGIPRDVAEAVQSPYRMLTPKEAAALLPSRKPRSNKGSYGKVLLFAGSREMAGAAYLAAKSAYRAGAGLVYCLVPEEIASTLQILIPEAITLPYEAGATIHFGEKAENILASADVLAAGPGLGQSPAIRRALRKLLRRFSGQIVLDADGLNLIQEDPRILRDCQKIPLITPHPGEMSRLTGKPVTEILASPLTTAKAFAEKYRAATLLKDHRTVIARPDGEIYLNPSGNTALAKGGSGDVLTGLVAGLGAQGMDIFHAAALGAWLHGRAGELLSETMTEYAPLAGEIADAIPEFLRRLKDFSFCMRQKML